MFSLKQALNRILLNAVITFYKNIILKLKLHALSGITFPAQHHGYGCA